MASCLAGDRLAAGELSVADRADQLRRAVEVLRKTDERATQDVADGIEAWLTKGGDLQRHLGVRVRRGGAQELPHRQSRKTRRDQELRALAARLPISAGPRASQIKQLLLARDPAVLIIHEQTAAVPTSDAQLRRILHGI